MHAKLEKISPENRSKAYFGCIEIGEHEVYGDDVWRQVHGQYGDMYAFI